MTWNWNQNQNQNTNQPAANPAEAWSQAPADTASPWDNFETVDAASQRNEFVPPHLDTDCTIIEMKVVQSVKNNNRPVFICTIETDATAEAPARRFDWVAKADERPYLRNIKALVIAINPQGDPSSFGRALMDELCGPSQPATGKRVHLRSEQIQTRSGNDFTKVYWSPALNN